MGVSQTADGGNIKEWSGMKMGYGNGPRNGHRIASVAAGRQSRLVVHFLVILHKRDWAYSGVKKTSVGQTAVRMKKLDQAISLFWHYEQVKRQPR